MPPENDSWCYGGDSGSGDDYVGDGSFPGGGHNGHQSTELWADVSAEASTSLAPAKPIIIENSDQSEVSRLFTPLAIVLYHNGLDNSQALRLPPARTAAATVRGTTMRGSASSSRSAECFKFRGREMKSQLFVPVSQFSREDIRNSLPTLARSSSNPGIGNDGSRGPGANRRAQDISSAEA